MTDDLQKPEVSLVKRLRDLAIVSNDGVLRGPALQAADRIEQLVATCEALEREVERLEGNLQSYQCFTLDPYTDEEIIAWLRDFRSRWVTERIRFAAVDIIDRRTARAEAAEAKVATLTAQVEALEWFSETSAADALAAHTYFNERRAALTTENPNG
jgi:cell division protein FtsB